MFLFGVLIQRHFDRLRPWLVGRGAYWLAAYTVMVFGLRRVGVEVGSNTPSPLPMLVLAMTVLSLAYTATSLSRRLLRGNDISYGAYIYHAVVLNVFIALGAPRTLGTIALIVLVTGVFAWLSWTLVEKPALRRKTNPLHPVNAGAAPRR